MSKKILTGESDSEVIAILNRYKCPTPFHEVRTIFMGNIASPVLDTAPMAAVKQLWHGEVPAFDSMDDANELLTVLMEGLWNRLTEFQSDDHPFKLLLIEGEQTRDGLKHFALVRRQELDGFVAGLFGSHEEIDLPEGAHVALGLLSEIRSMLGGTVDLLDDKSKAATPYDIKGLLKNFQHITIIAEAEINKAIISCKRSRNRSFQTMPATKPTLH